MLSIDKIKAKIDQILYEALTIEDLRIQEKLNNSYVIGKEIMVKIGYSNTITTKYLLDQLVQSIKELYISRKFIVKPSKDGTSNLYFSVPDNLDVNDVYLKNLKFSALSMIEISQKKLLVEQKKLEIMIDDALFLGYELLAEKKSKVSISTWGFSKIALANILAEYSKLYDIYLNDINTLYSSDSPLFKNNVNISFVFFEKQKYKIENAIDYEKACFFY